jgi:predicted component of type VI protein secretion system
MIWIGILIVALTFLAIIKRYETRLLLLSMVQLPRMLRSLGLKLQIWAPLLQYLVV